MPVNPLFVFAEIFGSHPCEGFYFLREYEGVTAPVEHLFDSPVGVGVGADTAEKVRFLSFRPISCPVRPVPVKVHKSPLQITQKKQAIIRETRVIRIVNGCGVRVSTPTGRVLK